jgi:hypothetical protein
MCGCVGVWVWVWVGVYTKSKSSELSPLRRKLLRFAKQFPPPLRSNKKYENKIQVLTTTIIGEQQQQDGAEIPPPLQSKYHTFVKE